MCKACVGVLWDGRWFWLYLESRWAPAFGGRALGHVFVLVFLHGPKVGVWLVVRRGELGPRRPSDGSDRAGRGGNASSMCFLVPNGTFVYS